MSKKIIISSFLCFILGFFLHKPITKALRILPIRYIEIKEKLYPLRSDEDIINATFINDDHVQDLYQMLKDVTDLFHKENISYSLTGGSLLGAVRQGGHIPWDDDMDLMINQQMEVKLNQLSDTLKTLGYNLTVLKDMYKISKISSNMTSRKSKDNQFTYPWIDIFVMHHNKIDKVVEYYKYLNKKNWPKDWFYEDDFFPLKEHKFGPLTVCAAKSPEVYLSQFYGDNWREEANIFPKHAAPGISKKYKKAIIRKIQGAFAKPALPSRPLIDRIEYVKPLCGNSWMK
jgi:phosphorylcholine metabolism protein LicD